VYLIGVNIVATLHQPRQEILDLCHSLILLGAGGKMIYNGSAFDVGLHFSKLSYTPPIRSNVADFAMDVLAGFIPNNSQILYSVAEVNEIFTTWWAQHRRDAHMKLVDNETYEVDKHISRMKTLRDKKFGELNGVNNVTTNKLSNIREKMRSLRVASSRQNMVRN
jgi:hypothetical protein